MKKILILTDSDFVGGAETNYKHIWPELKKNGWYPIFVSSGSEQMRLYFFNQGMEIDIMPAFHKYYSFSVNNRISPINIFKTWVAVLRNRSILKKLIKSHQPAAIVSNSMVSHWLLSIVRTGSSCRKIMHLHDIIEPKKAFGLYGRSLNRIASKMDNIIVVSEPVRAQFLPNLRTKTIKIYNPAEAPSIIKHKSTHTLRIGMFARYTPWKGHQDFLEIAKAFPSHDYQFVCYGNYTGNETYYEELKATASHFPNSESIHLNGFCYDIYSEMAKCDIILQLSLLPDPSPKVLIEANLCLVPVYAYEGGGVKEMFAELSLAGIMVPGGDKESMIREIKNFTKKQFSFPGLQQLNPATYFSQFEEVIS